MRKMMVILDERFEMTRGLIFFSSVYDAETDEDEPNKSKTSFELADFFHGKHFYVFDGDFNENTIRDIRRVIYAYDGILEKQLTSKVNYIITNRLWNSDFDKVENQSDGILLFN